MSTLIPLHAAHQVRQGVTEYLTTSFSLADRTTSEELAKFLTDPHTGMFRGPYVRTRLPYAPAQSDAVRFSWLPEWFRPYRHQAEAFARLRSEDQFGQPHQPEPTLVVTGTGSGKTESFLYPILDHCQRSNKKGIKALILYPMNALANDQELRLAKLLSETPGLANVTAGIYIGENDGQSKKMTDKHLISDRMRLRIDPPDILLTNYKMLDQLLLRNSDRSLWEISGDTLQYLVLDEFHTYDGAQGTDVALLLRRLELMLAQYRSQDTQRRVTPVATSATLGSDASPEAMLDFAHQVFGVEFPEDAVVMETSYSIEQWQNMMDEQHGVWESSYPEFGKEQIVAVNTAIAQASPEQPYDAVVHEVLCQQVFGCEPDLASALRAYHRHPLIVKVLECAHKSALPLVPGIETNVQSLVEQLYDRPIQRLANDAAAEFTTHLLTEISYLRARYGEHDKFLAKQLPGVETHLWIREVSRIDRAVGSTEGSMFRWYDDGPSDDTAWLPACYCRNCGRSGWMIALEPGGDQLVTSSQKIRRNSIENPGLKRPLLDAHTEALLDTTRDANDIASVQWLNLGIPRLSPKKPDERILEEQNVVPVLTYAQHSGKDDEYAAEQVCPSCGETDAILYLGSSVATLLSVALSNYFGQKHLDDDEKKTLIFTDSVQDAAHRAGFVQSRARTFALRTLIRKVIGNKTVSLDKIPDLLMDDTGSSARRRYELLPSQLVEQNNFKAYWDPQATPREQRAAEKEVAKRLAFDIVLEFGRRADLARSLSTTGAVTVMVDANTNVLYSAANSVLTKFAVQPLQPIAKERMIAWAWGVLEIMRIKGGVYHEWFKEYLVQDCNSYMLNRRESLNKGVSPFPRGSAPKFPRKGKPLTGASKREEGAMQLGAVSGFYTKWTVKMLGFDGHDSAKLVTNLFDELRQRDIVDAIHSEQGGELFTLAPKNIVVFTEEAPQLLECNVCHLRVSVAEDVRDYLAGCPCHNMGCQGTYENQDIVENYYRSLYNSTAPRTIVAREHTSLLETNERLGIEQAFKSTIAEAPNAPNVLVATPTLEMGIDIGDLSSVMLASLPSSVANYVQRVGRAGRLTGNSLAISLIRGRTATLPVLNAPLEMISGSVEPPAAYLGAEEILKRQFLAYLVESLNIPKLVPYLQSGSTVFSANGNTLVKILLKEATEERRQAALEKFVGTIAEFVADDVVDDLRSWVKEPTGLEQTINQAAEDWRADTKLLTERKRVLEKLHDELAKATTSITADEDTRSQYRSVKASLRHLSLQMTAHNQEFWIATLERYGLFPNFTLLDDSVEFNVAISSRDPHTLEFETQHREYSRAVSSALFELAPGATFYVQGVAARIDAVELGEDGGAIEQRRFCPSCSYSAPVIETQEAKSTSCPVCGEAKFADVDQVLDIVQMKKVSSEVERTRAAITDMSEDRRQMYFSSLTSIVYNKDDIGKQWFLNTGFGVTHLRRLELHLLNLGKGKGRSRTFGGREMEVPLFRVCSVCGHLDSEAGANRWSDHRSWCRLRKAEQESAVSFALARSLKTQGVLIHLPQLISVADNISVPSLRAAILLGFKLLLGGSPHHLDIYPLRTDNNETSLLIHDSVPGGTGYLTQFGDPVRVRELLYLAWQRLHSCGCEQTDRKACDQCLLPFAGQHADIVSRAAAEATLLKILTDTMHPDEHQRPAEHASWNVHERKPELSQESAFEAEFLRVFLQYLKQKSDIFQEKVTGRNREWHFRFAGKKHLWRMREQYNRGETIPDFYFSTDDPSYSNVALYLDGAAYHISKVNNRLLSDFRKRNNLRDSGDSIAWSVSWRQMENFKKLVEDQHVEPPAWFNSVKVTQLSAALNLTLQTEAGLWGDDSITQLIAFLHNPKRELWHNIALGAMLLRLDQKQGTVSGHPELALSVDKNNLNLEFKIASTAINQSTWETFLWMSNLYYAGNHGNTVNVVAPDSVVEMELAEPIESEREEAAADAAVTGGAVGAVGAASAGAVAGGAAAFDLVGAGADAAAGGGAEGGAAGAGVGAAAGVGAEDASVERSAATQSADTASIGDDTADDLANLAALQQPSSEFSAEWEEVLAEFEGEDDLLEALERLAHADIAAPTEIGLEIGGLATVVAWPDVKVAVTYEADDDLGDTTWTSWSYEEIMADSTPIETKLKG